MLCVPTYVAPSPIAGMGLFAAAFVPAGQVIWTFTEGVDWRIDPKDVEAFPEPYRTWLGHYMFQEDSGSFVLCGDNAKFMNHHRSPNCSDADPRFTITLRDIRVDEELTCNYLELDLMSRTAGLDFEVGSLDRVGERPQVT